jgi:hypothetical protein
MKISVIFYLIRLICTLCVIFWAFTTSRSLMSASWDHILRLACQIPLGILVMIGYGGIQLIISAWEQQIRFKNRGEDK